MALLNGAPLIKKTKVVLAFKTMACFLLFYYCWESLSPEIQMWSSLIFSQTFGSWQVGWGEGSEKYLQPEAKVKAVHIYQHVLSTDSETQEKPPMPSCSQLDFPGHLIQSEAVSFSSILQPINHVGNKTPDSVPSSSFWRVCDLKSQQFGTFSMKENTINPV